MIVGLLAAACAEPKTVKAADVRLEWTVQEGVLAGTARSKGPGWVAVGFNDRPTLDGSVLLMAAWTERGAVVEEHIAKPPSHPARHLTGTPGLLDSTVERVGGELVFTFRWRLQTADGWLPGLAVGKPAHITLAWSHDPDFSHHSARREMVSTTL